MQWGGFENGSNTFPIAFTTACYSATAGGEGDWGGSDISLVSITTTGFTAERETKSTLAKYMALGRQLQSSTLIRTHTPKIIKQI